VRGRYNQINKFLTYGTTDIFATVDIETTSQCNIKCPYCPVSKIDRGRHLMDEALYRKIIDELAEINFKGRVSPHFYGEPLVDKRLPALCAYARRKLPDADIVVHTNGTRFRQPIFDELIEAGVSGFVVTLHMGLATKTVDKLLADLNPEERKKIRFLDIDDTPLFNRTGLVEPEKEGMILRQFSRCYYLSDEIAISYSGNVLCTNDYLEKHSFGNVGDQKLMDIWHSPEFTRIRRDLRKGRFELEICKSCVAGCGTVVESDLVQMELSPGPASEPHE
jgi:8-amino-3,8-dideoxy-alpha-D-manno-octulosonate transaminase